MQRLPKQLVGNTQLTTSAVTYYTAGTNITTTIAAATVNNTSGTARTVTVHIIPSGGSATNSNQIISALVIPAAGAAPTTLPGLVGQVIAPGGFIQMLAEAATAITPLISGYETTP
jgi:hypothetical protein